MGAQLGGAAVERTFCKLTSPPHLATNAIYADVLLFFLYAKSAASPATNNHTVAGSGTGLLGPPSTVRLTHAKLEELNDKPATLTSNLFNENLKSLSESPSVVTLQSIDAPSMLGIAALSNVNT